MVWRHDTKRSVLLGAGGIAALGLFAAMVLYQAVYFRDLQQKEEAKLLGQPPKEVTRIQADQQSRLAQYRWIDRENGRVAIPIDRAMDLVAGELAAGKPLGGAPLPPASPAGAMPSGSMGTSSEPGSGKP